MIGPCLDTSLRLTLSHCLTDKQKMFLFCTRLDAHDRERIFIQALLSLLDLQKKRIASCKQICKLYPHEHSKINVKKDFYTL